MTQNYNELAERFMMLWQQQMQSMMKDGDFLKQCFDGLQNMANYTTTSPHEPSTKPTADAFAYELRQLEHRISLVEAELAKRKPAAAGNAGPKRAARSTAGTRKKAVRSTPRKRK